MRIEELDQNFKTENVNGLTGIIFTDVRKLPFSVYGLYDYRKQESFCRCPSAIAEATNPVVAQLYTNTAGGRVRFATDSEWIVIRAKWSRHCKMSHMTQCGICGFDLYEIVDGEERFIRVFVPNDADSGYTSAAHVEKRSHIGLRYYTIHFPLYNDVDSLEIGVLEGSRICEGLSYRPIPPVVYYGSSITQGGCATRPGNCYQNIISQVYQIDHINLGFSGSARGETVMAKYIAGLSMSAFVMDYDFNAPDAEHLKRTHETFFRLIRDKQPDVPVLFVSAPVETLNGEERFRVIRETYDHAVADGDRNVYLIDGRMLFGTSFPHRCTVDTVHPNDIGFERMANGIGNVLADCLHLTGVKE